MLRRRLKFNTAYPIGAERVLIMQNGKPAKLMIVIKTNNRIERELTLETRLPDKPHGQFRHIRLTKAGTFLVAHLDLGKVIEYSPDGKQIWSVRAPSARAAVRLANGNTLISGNRHGYVREVNPKGDIVWELSKSDLPGIDLYTVQEVQRLENGNTLINNWPGGLPLEEWPKVVQLIEVTPQKKVVWALLVAYVGTKGSNLFRSINIDQAFPGPAVIVAPFPIPVLRKIASHVRLPSFCKR